MDRLGRALTCGTLVLVVGTVATVSGCRSTRNEIPPGKPYATTGGTPPSLGFNSAPHPNSSIGAGLYGNSATPGQPGMPGGGSAPGLPGPDAASMGAASAPPQFGTPTPSAGNYGQPTANKYGPSMTPGSPGN
jgi:hypothetical protein